MKLKKLKIVIILISFTFLYIHTLSAHVGLDYPIGGETFSVGDTVNVQWHNIIIHTAIDWDLYFSYDGGSTWSPVQLNISKSQFNYQWIVPNILTEEAQIKIVQDNVGADYEENSSSFTIQEKSLAVFTPSQIPETPYLLQNYPNPFNPLTKIQFSLPQESNVSIVVFDLIGDKIKSLFNSTLLKGQHTIEWDGTNNLGVAVPSGTYLYNMTTNNHTQTMKMVLLR